MEQLVLTLPVEESARFNPDRLEELCNEMGEVRAEEEVARALREMAGCLHHLALLRREGRLNLLHRPLSRLCAAADRIGMASLSRVGADVRACVDSGDHVALAATLARLERVGDRSIHAIWELESLPG